MVKGGKEKLEIQKSGTRERGVEWADCDFTEKATNVRGTEVKLNECDESS